MSRRKRRFLYGAGIAALAAAGVGTALALALGGSGADRAAARPLGVSPVGTSLPVLRQRFAVLNRRHTNKCGFRPESLYSIAVNGRLQGSCCSPMNFQHYVGQVRGLVEYRALAQIPADPYDIPVAQAKQLLAYDRELTLTPAQQATYRRAMELADEHGPCCCHCWRWSTFEGQAKYLISRSGYRAAQIAKVWDLENGCGGGSA